MASSKVRADYEELKQLASGFKQAGEASARSLQAVRREKDVLQNGDWIGKGATAFYKEMDESVLPTLNRLVKALDSAATTTSQISGVMKQAEEEAAKTLDGSSLGGAAAGGAAGGLAAAGAAVAGAAAGAAGAVGAAAAGALGEALAGAGAAAAGAALGGVMDAVQDALGALGGGGASGGISGQAGGLGAAAAGGAEGAFGGSDAEFNDAVNSLDDVSDSDLSDAMGNFGESASGLGEDVVPPGFTDDTGGVGPVLSTLGSPNADSLADQVLGGAAGGGASGGGGGGGDTGGGGGSSGGGSSGGGGGGGSPSGGASPNIGGFSDAALQSILSNPNLSSSDKLLASAIQTLRRDPNAFNGALKSFVDQALAGGNTSQAAQAAGGGLKTLQGALSSAGTAQPQSVMDAVSRLQSQFNNIVPPSSGGGLGAAPIISPVVGSTPPASTGDAIMGLVQQLTSTISAIIPGR